MDFLDDLPKECWTNNNGILRRISEKKNARKPFFNKLPQKFLWRIYKWFSTERGCCRENLQSIWLSECIYKQNIFFLRIPMRISRAIPQQIPGKNPLKVLEEISLHTWRGFRWNLCRNSWKKDSSIILSERPQGFEKKTWRNNMLDEYSYRVPRWIANGILGKIPWKNISSGEIHQKILRESVQKFEMEFLEGFSKKVP